MYGKRGFTRKVLEILEKAPDYAKLYREPIRKPTFQQYTVDAKTLLQIATVLPPENLEDRQNWAPPLKAFVQLASEVPDTYYEIYVVTEERHDERVTVEGVIFPLNAKETVREILLAEGDEPDDEQVRGVAVRWWWD